MTKNLPEPVEWVDAELVDDVPKKKPVCWWRLGPNVRTPNKGSDAYGVYAGWIGRQIVLEQDGYQIQPQVEKWSFGITTEGHQYIDLLCFVPPTLPRPVEWQRITRWNDRRHPGNNMDRWEWDFDGPEAWY